MSDSPTLFFLSKKAPHLVPAQTKSKAAPRASSALLFPFGWSN